MDSLYVNRIITTEKRLVTEKALLMSILWEGDLELHTNKVKMEKSHFGKRILHGDAVVAMLMGLIRQKGFFLEKYWSLKGFSAEYKQPLFVGESIKGTVKVQEIKDGKVGCVFGVHKETGESVSSGKLLFFIKTGEVLNP